MTGMQVSPLGVLIDQARARSGWSDEDVARKARALGHKLSKTEVSNYRRDGMPTLVPDKIVALADGLEIPAWRVVEAALQGHGIRLPLDQKTTEDAIRGDIRIPSDERGFMLTMLDRAYAKENRRPERKKRSTES